MLKTGSPYPLDNEIDGMFLPKGSTVVLNVWAMHHDSDTWKDPQHFIPERFESYPSLASTYAASGKWDERDHYGYGAGRRICPGESNFLPVPPSPSSLPAPTPPDSPLKKSTDTAHKK